MKPWSLKDTIKGTFHLKTEYSVIVSSYWHADRKSGEVSSSTKASQWNRAAADVAEAPRTQTVETRISCTEPFWVQMLQLFSRTLQLCFTVKLQKCSVDVKTSPDFPSAWRWGDDNSGWTIPLNTGIQDVWRFLLDRVALLASLLARLLVLGHFLYVCGRKRGLNLTSVWNEITQK